MTVDSDHNALQTLHSLAFTVWDLTNRFHVAVRLFSNRDLKHQDGRHDDGIPEVYFPFRSCAEPEKLTAIRRRPVVGDATLAVLT